jgi:hypothetical protein
LKRAGKNRVIHDEDDMADGISFCEVLFWSVGRELRIEKVVGRPANLDNLRMEIMKRKSFSENPPSSEEVGKPT